MRLKNKRKIDNLTTLLRVIPFPGRRMKTVGNGMLNGSVTCLSDDDKTIVRTELENSI